MKKIITVVFVCVFYINVNSQDQDKITIQPVMVSGHKMIKPELETMVLLLNSPLTKWRNILGYFEYPDRFTEDNGDWFSSGLLLGEAKYAIVRYADHDLWIYDTFNEMGFSESPLGGLIEQLQLNNMFLRHWNGENIEGDLYGIHVREDQTTYYFKISRQNKQEMCNIYKVDDKN